MNDPSEKPKHGTLEEAFALLASTPLKSTKARRAILEILVKQHGPFSADEIFDFLKDEKKDRVTIYRTLLSFEKYGLVRRCEFGDGVSRYEFQCQHEHHHHVTCTVCRKTENIPDCSVAKVEKSVRDQGYESVSHTLEFFGVCKDCKKD